MCAMTAVATGPALATRGGSTLQNPTRLCENSELDNRHAILLAICLSRRNDLTYKMMDQF